ncbi:hypothetical protein J2S78_000594 [Salibacterium salarium]|uniref:S-layer homology domain-containing protein n=1 Tax=Salibacterium salarium TaxID=284579 RepID=UPI0027852955|nr:S-layer homology domain-containing protein [Salibacterium salarium]MDQ0298186.1 hypothetical protein [Salibacterium salarium]
MKKWLAVSTLVVGVSMFGNAALGADEDIGTPSNEELSYKQKKDLLTEEALEKDIPPEILKAIAFEETGMRQFDENGDPVLNENEDGGIGIMQVTLNEDDFENRNVDQDRLENDTAYNIEIGAELLNEKWEWSGDIIPSVNDGNRHILENWYYAILAYNGLDQRNDPTNNGDTYQSDIYSTIEDKSFLEDVSIDTPEWEGMYKDGENRIRFEEGENVTTDRQTLSTQMFENGEDVYTFRSESETTINFREESANTSRLLSEVPLYMPLEVEGSLEHDDNRDHHFGYYPFYYADIHGYMASAYVREGEITNFSDVRNQKLTEVIGYLEARDIINGYPDGTFAPNKSIPRKHAASMLVEALDLDVPDDYELQATDVEEDSPYYSDMKAVEYHGLMTGSDQNIRPNETMTRAQMASVLVAAYDEKLPATEEPHKFEDVTQDFWNYEAIDKLYQHELTTEDPFRPGGDVTRSQFARFLERAMTK